MKKRRFGKTGWQVYPVGLGCWGLGGKAYGPVDEAESVATLKRAYEKGVNFFDTADIYGFGRSEELIGEVLENKTDIYIATKVGHEFEKGLVRKNWNPIYIERAAEKSLKRLRREVIDLYQLHNPSAEIIKRGEVFDILEKLKVNGKIKAYGISVFNPEEGMLAIDAAPNLTSVQCILNRLDSRTAENLLPYCYERNIAVIAREPLACGILAGKITAQTAFPKEDHRAGWPKEKLLNDLKRFEPIRQVWLRENLDFVQAALQYVLSFQQVSVVIPGAKRPDQLPV